jgi:hypothetical protein
MIPGSPAYVAKAMSFRGPARAQHDVGIQRAQRCAEYERALNNASLQEPRLIGRNATHLQLLIAEEVDLLRDLPAAGFSLAELLEQKNEETARNMGAKSFLFRIMPDRLRHRGASRQHALNNWADSAPKKRTPSFPLLPA